MAVDPNIKKKADDIRNKIYGKEVRESLASGLEEMSSDVVENEGRQSVVEGRQDSVESQWQVVSDEMTDKDVISAPEIIAARDGEANLKARLDKEKNEVTAQLAQTVKVINIIGDGVKDNTDELETAINTGETVMLSGNIVTTKRISINNPVNIVGKFGNLVHIAFSIKSSGVTIDGLNFRQPSFDVDQIVWTGEESTRANDLTIRNCTFKDIIGTGVEISSRFVTVENIILENLTFDNCSFFGLIINGLNGKTHPGNNLSIVRNLRISNCHASNCGSDEQPWGVGIDICEQIDLLENCIVENCSANYNYQSGFHMESYPTKKNVIISNCTAIGNGTGTLDQTIASGFSCVAEGVTLVNCFAKDNKRRDYNTHGNSVRVQQSHGTIIDCVENDMLINWNEHLANEVYSGDNLILNGDFKFGSLFFDRLWRQYALNLYHTPHFMARDDKGIPQAIVKQENLVSLNEGSETKRYIHGKFATNIFKLDPSKKYKLSVLIDSSQNTNLATIGVILTRYNWVSQTDISENTVIDNKSLGTVFWTHNEPEPTWHDLEIGLDTTVPLPDNGYYNLSFDNTADLTDDKINRIYGIKLIEV